MKGLSKLITETHLEKLALDWFIEQGYEYRFGPDIAYDGNAPERRDHSQVILYARLLKALKKINPDIQIKKLEEVVNSIGKVEHLSLIANNRSVHQKLVDGVDIEIEIGGEKRGDSVKLIDLKNPLNNEFLVVNQFTLKGTKKLQKPDIVIFINGLPLAVIELKMPTEDNEDIWSSFNQLQMFKLEIPDLFLFNEALVVSNGIRARIGSLTANSEEFMPWRTVEDGGNRHRSEIELKTLIKGFFKKEMLLDYIQNFILYEESGNSLVKRNARYHQFYAVQQAVKATLNAEGYHVDRSNNTIIPSYKKGGVVWQTQGSGKSSSMAYYAGKISQMPKMQNPTIIVVTDRNDLEMQLFQTFCNAKMLLKQLPIKIESIEALRETLEDRPAGGILFITRQRLFLKDKEDTFPLLTDRHNVVVIVDNAYGRAYARRGNFNKEIGDHKYDYSEYISQGLPNATFIGFTGVPISSKDKLTFGEYINTYDIQDAVNDGSIVPIYYEDRFSKLQIKEPDILFTDDTVEEIVEDYEDIFSQENIKSDWMNLESIIGAEPRIGRVARDIIDHFNTRVNIIEGKAIIVCMSRDICVHLYNKIVKFKPEWHSEDPMKGTIKVIMSGSPYDKELLRPHIYNERIKKQLEKRFKDPRDDLKIVIVRDMWLTGFDAPICHTMYIDKPMKGQNLMQAMARVNRVNRGKEGGLIVDYFGVATELNSVVENYMQSNGKGRLVTDIHNVYKRFCGLVDIVRDIFKDFDYSDYRKRSISLLLSAANHILETKNGQQRYFDLVLLITKVYSICGTLDEALKYREEIAFFQGVKIVIAKFSGLDKKLSEEQEGSVLKQFFDNSSILIEVDKVFAFLGLEKSEDSALSDEFLGKIRDFPQQNLAVELLQRILSNEIKSKDTNNIFQEKNLFEIFTNILNEYHNGIVESSQVIEELIILAQKFRQATVYKADLELDLDLNSDELLFYGILANNKIVIGEVSINDLKKIAKEITEKLRENTSVDWQMQDSVRARLRNLIRITLRRYKYPSHRIETAIELVLTQAEILTSVWSSDM